MNTFYIVTQTLENYSQSENSPYYKFKGGSTFRVHGLERVQDAVAFIATKYRSDPSQIFIEIPIYWYSSYEEWYDTIKHLDLDYQEFLISLIQNERYEPNG